MSVVASSMMFAGGDIAPVEVEAPVTASESGFYAGVAYSYMDGLWTTGKSDSQSSLRWKEIEYKAAMLQAGYKVNKYFAVEGRYWTTFGDGDHRTKDEEYSDSVFDYTSVYGIYAKPMYPVMDDFNVYGLLGYAHSELENESGMSQSGSDRGAEWTAHDDGGFSYGIGADYAVSENISLFVDYVVLFDDVTMWNEYDDGTESRNLELTTWNFGVTYKF